MIDETGPGADAWRISWLRPLLGTITGTGQAPQAYMIALRHVAVTLDGDPAWRDWWRSAGVTECELGMVAEDRLDHLRPSADIRMAGHKIRANFTCALPTGADEPPAGLLDLATIELTGMFEVIREALGLSALPPVPAVPPVPERAREVEVTTKPLPVEPREVDQQGYLTLAQIQEFFG
ncbi:MAG TPA: hypothetical protein VFR35_00365 [Actinoplanes sp.]|nr:hypothetical protein [Actinoplanes sp.]